ncbi:maleylpyruvate isomerase N-terminal domain-containing protein [Actinopolymorpha sp. B17G11]|uniref:maleylpyruvate isomerase N-terminal domain-containing protein n=1 Tax=Actinopolymorpha sp. B17G11 TaxID=3160861 RepID=UPI0032E52298
MNTSDERLRAVIELTLERYGQGLVDQIAQLAEAARGAVVDAAVPRCPEWTLSQLVEHVGQTQHWVASIVEKRVSDPSQLPTSVAALPADQDAWASWLAEGASRLGAACVDADADAPVWNPAGDGLSGTRFWLRRVLAETIIHGPARPPPLAWSTSSTPSSPPMRSPITWR